MAKKDQAKGPSLRITLEVTGGVGLLVMQFLNPPPPPATVGLSPETPTLERFCAPFGDHREVRLRDGSVIQLNSAACITTELTDGARWVLLEQGEAIFVVAADPSRPFVVTTGAISIRALGTQFDVYRKGISTRVAVIEGAVKVASSSSMSHTEVEPLTALKQVDFRDDTAEPMVSSITFQDFERMTAWTHGDIELANQTLKESLDEFKRYRHIEIVFKDKAIERIRVGGYFHTNGLDSFVELLKFRCIHYEYDKAAQRFTLSTEPGKRAGTACR